MTTWTMLSGEASLGARLERLSPAGGTANQQAFSVSAKLEKGASRIGITGHMLKAPSETGSD
ncbi:hypothetical protein C6W88_04625 [Halomonas litopenaei]|uniref:Uncharacterized protein n=1 Tax=Halomonas litopenaei TaxID=2109328 RepID=A0ABX5J4U4_9GAMM|nr:hypothetical protein C6W89_00540 [Halomonas sp. SYSU XM8]PTL95738.1 hypothetical protein C6W88_04625 [Halomonas litopenaei]